MQDEKETDHRVSGKDKPGRRKAFMLELEGTRRREKKDRRGKN